MIPKMMTLVKIRVEKSILISKIEATNSNKSDFKLYEAMRIIIIRFNYN